MIKICTHAPLWHNWLIYCILALFASPAGAAIIEGVNVRLQPPPGFTQTQAFTGFQQMETFSSIQVDELEAPFQTLATQLTPEFYATTNTRLVDSRQLQSGSRDALLLELETELSGAQLNKWVLLIGDALRSITITATYPRWAADTMREPLKASLLSAEWLRTDEEQFLHDLPFIVSQSEDLKFSRRTANMLVLADTGETGELRPAVPAITIGHLASKTALPDIKTLSHGQIDQLQSIDIIEILEEKETTIDGIRSYEIVARVRLNATGIPHLFRQILTVQSLRYLLIHASVDEREAQKYQPQFNRVIASIAFK